MSNKPGPHTLSIKKLYAENIEIAKTINGIRSNIKDIDDNRLLQSLAEQYHVDISDRQFDSTRISLASLKAMLLSSITTLEEISLLSSRLPNLDTSDAQRMLEEATKC